MAAFGRAKAAWLQSFLDLPKGIPSADTLRRTKVLPHLWDEGSVVKLVFAVLIRVSERWGKKGFSEFEQQQIRRLRRRLKLDEPRVTSSPPTAEPHTRRSAASAA
jgi:hypothetical protein